MSAHVCNAVGKPERGPDIMPSQLADYTGHKGCCVEVNYDLTACVYCGADDSSLGSLVEAWHGSARGHRDPVGEPVAIALAGAAELSGVMSHALECVDDVVSKVILRDLSDDADSHATSLALSPFTIRLSFRVVRRASFGHARSHLHLN